MSDAELRYADQLDVGCVLFHNKDILSLLVTDPGQLGGFIVPKNDEQAIDFTHRLALFHQCEGAVRSAVSPEAGPYALCDRFREVLTDVLGGREMDSFTNADAQAIAARYPEWLDLPLDGAWISAAYIAR